MEMSINLIVAIVAAAVILLVILALALSGKNIAEGAMGQMWNVGEWIKKLLEAKGG